MHYTSKAVYEYISKKMEDPIVKWKKCRLSGQDFPIYQSDLEFYDKISPKFEVTPEYAKNFLEKHKDIAENFEYNFDEVDEKTGMWKLKCKIPTPTLCPEERQRRRLAFRNERKLYKRTCVFSWKEIISIYSPDQDFKVYDQNIWRSDKWDAFDYGKAINFKTNPIDTISTIIKEIPWLNLMDMENENSIYTNYTLLSKNVYMCNDTMNAEDVYYSNIIKDSAHCLDLTDCKNCEQSGYLVRCQHAFNSFYCYDCKHITKCMFVENSSNCENCLFCYTIHGKKNYLFNKPATAEEIQKIKQKIRNNQANKELQQRKNMLNEKINNSTNTLWSENVYGNLLFNSKNSALYFDSYEIENCKYGIIGDKNTDCQDNTICNPNNYLSYELISWWEQKNCYCNVACGHAQWVYFSHLCMYCSHLFGCVGLHNKEYCIFNKQYTKEEYNQLVPKIIAQMMREGQRGEFFHPQLSPFGYNETVAMEYYPLTKEETLKLWYKRSDYETPFPKVEKFVQWSKLRTASCKTIHEQKPELLEKLLNYAVVCEVSGRPFRIIKQEIDFYIKHDLPLPRKHPDIRHQERMDKRPWRILYLRNCDKCGKEMLSVYDTNTQQVTLSLSKGSLETSKKNASINPAKSGVNSAWQLSVTQSEAKSLETDTMDSSAKASEWQKIYCEKCYQKAIYG